MPTHDPNQIVAACERETPEHGGRGKLAGRCAQLAHVAIQRERCEDQATEQRGENDLAG
jgi:hypothetical protein